MFFSLISYYSKNSFHTLVDKIALYLSAKHVGTFYSTLVMTTLRRENQHYCKDNVYVLVTYEYLLVFIISKACHFSCNIRIDYLINVIYCVTAQNVYFFRNKACLLAEDNLLQTSQIEVFMYVIIFYGLVY